MAAHTPSNTIHPLALPFSPSQIRIYSRLQHGRRMDARSNTATPSILSPNNDNGPNDEDSTPFWKLLLILEPLLLAPFSKTEFSSPHQALRARITNFKRGNIIELINNTWTSPTTPAPPTPTSTPPHPTDNKATSTDNKTILRASLAAELDNFHTAYTCLTATLPVATLTDPVIQRVQQKLFPDRIPPPPPIPTPSDQPRRSQRHPLTAPPLLLDHNQTAAVLHKLKRGTAPGPFASTIDSIAAYGLHQSTSNTKSPRPYLKPLTQLLNLLLQGQVPASIQPHLTANYFLALHKDQSNLTKLRPIGIGTALRRVTATAALYLTAPNLARFLPFLGQFGIQTPVGIDLAVQTTISQVSQFIATPNIPTRALLLLDLTNMFSAVSRHACRIIIQQRPATLPLLPLFDLPLVLQRQQSTLLLSPTRGLPTRMPSQPLACLSHPWFHH